MHKNDIIALLSTITGVCSLASDGAFGSALDKLVGSHAASIGLAALGVIGMVAGQIIRSLNVPAGSTASVQPPAAQPPQNGT